MHNVRGFIIAGVAVLLLIAGLLTTVTLAQPAPPGRRVAQRCESVLPSRTADPVLAKYRERLRTARENMRREEGTLVSLMAAESTTRAAADAQMTKINDVRSALARVRLDMLWELRSVIPAENREQAFRCAGRLLFRRR